METLISSRDSVYNREYMLHRDGWWQEHDPGTRVTRLEVEQQANRTRAGPVK